MIMRHAVDEGIRPARAEATFFFARPDIGAKEAAPAHARKHDRLRAISAFDPAILVTALELFDQQIAEKAPVVGKPLECDRTIGEARFVLGLERRPHRAFRGNLRAHGPAVSSDWITRGMSASSIFEPVVGGFRSIVRARPRRVHKARPRGSAAIRRERGKPRLRHRARGIRATSASGYVRCRDASKLREQWSRIAAPHPAEQRGRHLALAFGAAAARSVHQASHRLRLYWRVSSGHFIGSGEAQDDEPPVDTRRHLPRMRKALAAHDLAGDHAAGVAIDRGLARRFRKAARIRGHQRHRRELPHAVLHP